MSVKDWDKFIKKDSYYRYAGIRLIIFKDGTHIVTNRDGKYII